MTLRDLFWLVDYEWTERVRLDTLESFRDFFHVLGVRNIANGFTMNLSVNIRMKYAETQLFKLQFV